MRTCIKSHRYWRMLHIRCKYFEAGVHIKNPIKSYSYQGGLGRTTQTLDHVEHCGPYINHLRQEKVSN